MLQMSLASDRPAIVVRAPAKVNLTLEVLGKRPDGFHALRSVFAALSLHDRLAVYPASDIVLECDVPELASTSNLAWRSVDALRRDAGIRAGARIVLEKRIPLEAGLGGGSADAAGALVAANAHWNLGYSRERLREIGATIGSDVPFFLGDGPLALVTGRGEILHPLPVPTALLEAHFVLVKPPIGVSAGAVYRAFPPSRWSVQTNRTSLWIDASRNAPHLGSQPAPFNDLEPHALEVAPGSVVARDALIEAGAPHAVMSGSGSTFFACLEAADAARVESSLRTMPAVEGWFIAVATLGELPLRPQRSAD